jgi:hypothetical protein
VPRRRPAAPRAVPLLLLAWLVLAAALGAPAARAVTDAEVGMEDERIMLSEPDKAPAAVAAWRDMGVDVVRVHARWFEIAPAQAKRRRPRGFHAADPQDRRYHWHSLDNAVGLIQASGMRMFLTITGPGPLWATRHPREGKPRRDPRPREYARFARAVATRYGAIVDRYTIWNEPNQAGWLQPQSRCVGRTHPKTCTLAAPHIYRGLVQAALPAIKRADPGAEVLAGELAPIGLQRRSGGAPIPPLTFLRALACVDEHYRPLRTGPCRRFKPVPLDALAYHPHGVKNGPERTNPDPDSAQIADLRRLERVLDRLTDSGRLRSPGGRPLDIHLSEFSYQTAPPDRATGISLRRQAVYQQQAAYLAWRDRRVKGLTQYQWQDELVRNKGTGSKRFAGWQGGLHFYDGRPKPARRAFEAPFVADVADDGGSVRLWGQVRPGGAHAVTVLAGTRRSGPLTPLITLPTTPGGTWTYATEFRRPTRFAARWMRDDGTWASTPVLPVRAALGGRLVAAP